MVIDMATLDEMVKELDSFKRMNREKEREMRKAITRQKRKEDAQFTREVGKVARKYFANFTSIEQFEQKFAEMTLPEQPMQRQEQHQQEW